MKWTFLTATAIQSLIASNVHTQTIEYIHADALGSTVAVTDANQGLIERTEYEPYGAQLNRPMQDRPGYTGHVGDAETGLNYMQQRYYDAQVGRFLSIDPVAPDESNGANFNRYKYASGNPYKFIDPDGRSDVNYFHKNDSLYAAANRFDLPGFTTVTGHAWPDRFQDNRQRPRGAGPGVSDETLKRDVRSAMKPGDYIYLGGCTIGQGGTPAMMAKEFNTNVLSTRGFVFTDQGKDGSISYVSHETGSRLSPRSSFNMTSASGRTYGSIKSVTMKADGTAVFRTNDAPTGTRIRPVIVIRSREER